MPGIAIVQDHGQDDHGRLVLIAPTGEEKKGFPVMRILSDTSTFSRKRIYGFCGFER